MLSALPDSMPVVLAGGTLASMITATAHRHRNAQVRDGVCCGGAGWVNVQSRTAKPSLYKPKPIQAKPVWVCSGLPVGDWVLGLGRAT